MTKRTFDLIVGTLALVLVSPVLLFCAIAVWLNAGRPVFYIDTRLGLNGMPFRMLKFRSMHRNAADIRNPDGSTYNGPSDQRVTPVGRWLRKLSLDELPQLINVIRGDMSIVGPRPELPDGLKHYRAGDHLRLAVRPGITGWAQIHGRNTLSLDARRELDVDYVQRRTLLIDLIIILRTIPVLISGHGVYIGTSQHG